MKTKTYIQPATRTTSVALHSIICLSVDEGGKKTSEEVWGGADAPKRKISTLYI